MPSNAPDGIVVMARAQALFTAAEITYAIDAFLEELASGSHDDVSETAILVVEIEVGRLLVLDQVDGILTVTTFSD